MTNPSSVCVVGGGHNGLVCAIMLAKAGWHVTVLEARTSLGGAIAPRTFAPGFQAPGLAHHYGQLHPKILKDLGLPSKSGPPIDTIALDRSGDHATLGGTEASGNNLTPEDKKAYSAFKTDYTAFAQALEPLLLNKPPRLKDMGRDDQWTLAKIGWSLRFGLGVPSMREFLRVGGANIYDVLNEIFDNELIKGAIAADAVMGHHLGPRTPTSVLPFLLRTFSESHSGPTVSAHHGNHLASDLERIALSYGIELRTETKVERIRVVSERAAGVVLEGGESSDSDVVVSNVYAKSTFLTLTGASNLDAMFTHRISKTRTNGNVAKLHLGLSAAPQFEGLSAAQLQHRIVIAPDMRFVERAFNHAKYGEYSPHPIVDITIPSLRDPSLAPDGKHVMSISA
ncbi:MAG: NAD(P)/FAD-dependent oxidoreductase, partial [Pseudomonadota bacterium]